MPDTLTALDPATGSAPGLTTGSAPVVPAVPTAPDGEPVDLAEALVEEVSIDGMCGVY